MTDKKDKALKLALEALEAKGDAWIVLERKAKAAICEALAEQPAQQQEPDYHICPTCGGMASDPIVPPEDRFASKPWVGLTEEQVFELIEANTEWKPAAGLWRLNEVEFARAIEAKLREKNQ